MKSFDPENPIIKLCAEGMQKEAEMKIDEAMDIFQNAWNTAQTDLEKSVAAHYLARNQDNLENKLHWDQIALDHAQNLSAEIKKDILPSLHLNLAKGFEDSKDPSQALKHYQLAKEWTTPHAEDGYGKMIQGGIEDGIERMGKK